MIEVDVKLKVGTFTLDVAFANGAGVTALFGQSGSGKSVTLNLIAGLMRPDKGHIRLDGEALVDTEQGIFLPMHRRRIGLVFQDSNLFPHLSVKQKNYETPEHDAIKFDRIMF
jgi:molybdate transport system ATP-binding protein